MNPTQAIKQAPQRPNRMVLTALRGGKIARPLRVLAYGTEGVGKSTFAADAPSPVFLCSEDGTAQLDVQRFPEPRAWADVFDAVDTLLAGGHEHKTLVLDTLDWMEPLCWAHVCAAKNWKNIEDPGFGKGYVPATDEWRKLLARLDELRNKAGMHIVLLAHSQVKMFSNPEGENFDRYELMLQKSASGLVRQWCDDVLFCSFEEFAVKGTGARQAKGVSEGARIIRTERRAAFDAKNRHGLPFQLSLSWADYWDAVQAGTPKDAGALDKLIRELVAGTPIEEKAIAAADKAAGDALQLAKILDHARGQLNTGDQS
jgi:hypothetical protein